MLTDKTLLNIKQLASEISANGKQFDFTSNNTVSIFSSIASGSNEMDRDIVASKIGTTLLDEIGLYKNTFNPILKEYITNVKKDVLTTVPNKANSFSIVDVDLPSIVKDNGDKFINRVDRDTLINIREKPILPFDITEMTHSDPTLNRYIKEMFTKEDYERPNDYFNLLTEIIPYSTPYLTVADKLVKAWLIANYIKDQKMIELGIGVNTINSIIWRLEAFISKAKEEYTEYINSERLFLSLDKKAGDTTIYVLKPVYDGCIDVIGLADALYGIAIQDMNKRHILTNSKTSIIANKDKLAKLFEAYVVASKFESPVDRSLRIRKILVNNLEKLLRDLDDKLLLYHVGGTDISKFRDDVNLLVKNTLTDDDTFLERICISIIAGCLFNNTNYFKFITSVEKFLTKDSNLTVDDVVPYVLTEILTDFIMNKCKVFNIAK